MLWNRSLVMLDQETESLWSHILGEAMQGELKGTKLEILPAEMVSWEAWLREHPQTTVLNMRRTADRFTDEFYLNPEDFVFAWTSGFQAYSISFDILIEHPVLNIKIDGWPLVITFDPESTSAHLLSRQVGDKYLYFLWEEAGLMSDQQTGSTWNSYKGLALEGQLKGETLEHQAGIVSYAGAWEEFHPNSKSLTHMDDVGID